MKTLPESIGQLPGVGQDEGVVAAQAKIAALRERAQLLAQDLSSCRLEESEAAAAFGESLSGSEAGVKKAAARIGSTTLAREAAMVKVNVAVTECDKAVLLLRDAVAAATDRLAPVWEAVVAAAGSETVEAERAFFAARERFVALQQERAAEERAAARLVADAGMVWDPLHRALAQTVSAPSE